MTPVAHPDWLRPPWRSPGVGALMTTRAGGSSHGRFASFNLRDGLGDDPAHVAANRSRFAAVCGATPAWLEQVHGTRVVRLDEGSVVPPTASLPTADASVTTVPGVACVVQVADCLPVLFAAPGGAAVGAAHAGWRGLAGGVLEATLAAVCEAGHCAPGEVRAWLGAAIGPRNFEVGPDVLQAFGVDPDAARTPPPAAQAAPRFLPHATGKWLADLPQLARDRLQAAGVVDISGGTWCTVAQPSRFFSFRRDGVTGRMAAAVWIERGA